MTVLCAECPKCQAIIYSRSLSDMKYCPCGAIFIDGGPDNDYVRVGTSLPEICTSNIRVFRREIDATKKDLYDDWNYNINKFGVIENLPLDDYWS
jgi:hypothetical protein